MIQDYVKRGDHAASGHRSPHDLHRFRIRTKKLRYTLELFGELFAAMYGPALKLQVEDIKRVHNLLGDINDCVTVTALVEPYAGSKALAAALKKRRHKKTEQFREYWKKDFQGGAALRAWVRELR
jgi:CHAD domain-containing protein